MADSSKKKTAIVSVCSLLLVAMVVALVYTQGEEKPDSSDVSASQKAITNLCQSTDYQQTCFDSLKNSKSSDPKELIQMAFQAAIEQINKAAENSTVLADLGKDPRGKAALDSCRELAHRAGHDLERSFAKFKDFDVSVVDNIMSDLQIWLSGAITYQETCLDGFDGVEGDAGLKMREFLTTSMQMTSNGLAMVTGISEVLQSVIGQENYNSGSRRLLSKDEMPEWIGFTKRKLLKTSRDKIKPNLVVAKDGSGNFTTVNEALKFVPKNGNTTFVLYIKEGVYEEKVTINATMKYLMVVGDGPTKTKITGSLNFIDGTNTYHTATVAVHADHFIARDIGFENSAGAEKHQAVALRVSADMAIFYNCQMDGYQDTLYAHTYRQFYRECVISGTIDFIFGDSAAVFQSCTLVVRKPLSNQQNIVTAQGRKDIRQPTGLVLQNCSFVADPEYYPLRFKNKAYLGRPWKEYSRTIIIESFIDDLIQPEGWLPWSGDFALQTLFYTEFNNRGPGSSKEGRVKWPGVKELPAKRIRRFTANRFIDGIRWVEAADIPYERKFMFKVPKADPNVEYSPVGPEESKDIGNYKEKASLLSPKSGGDEKKKGDDGSKNHAPKSQITAAPSMAPALSPVAQPGGTVQSSFNKLGFRGW